MAFVTRTKESLFRKATEMQINDVIEGYYLGIEKSAKGYTNIKLSTKSGQIISVSPSGNLSYFQKDTEAGTYVINQFTRITKVAERPSKKDVTKTVGVFRVEQDPQDLFSGLTLTSNMNSGTTIAAVAPNLDEVKQKIKNLNAKTA